MLSNLGHFTQAFVEIRQEINNDNNNNNYNNNNSNDNDNNQNNFS